MQDLDKLCILQSIQDKTMRILWKFNPLSIIILNFGVGVFNKYPFPVLQHGVTLAYIACCCHLISHCKMFSTLCNIFKPLYDISNEMLYYSSAADRPTDFSCQIGLVRFSIYLPRLKFGCPQKCMCLAMSKC